MTDEMKNFVQLYGLDKLEGVNEIQCFKLCECIGNHLPKIRRSCLISTDAFICEIGDTKAKIKKLIYSGDLLNISVRIKCALPPKPLDDNLADFAIFRDIIEGIASEAIHEKANAKGE